MKMHDKATSEVQVLIDKERDEDIRKVSNMCQSLCYKHGDYLIFPLNCAEDLIKESEVLHHCVRTYVDKVAKEDCVIMFIRKADDVDTPYITLELKKKDDSFKIISQVRGLNNSKPDGNVEMFIESWRAKYHLINAAA